VGQAQGRGQARHRHLTACVRFQPVYPTRKGLSVARIVAEYKRLRFTTAIDDFGTGHAGLSLLTTFQPDIIKIDMEIIRGIAGSAARQAIVAGIMLMARSLDIAVIAEGVEDETELAVLREAGIRLFQGYLFARPAIERLPPVAFTETALAS
jgi:EAL domain-containing protein (putative c-di-GMP-specific phosphodiesterase class I)